MVEGWAVGDRDLARRGKPPALPVFGPLAAQAKRVLDLARREASELNHHWVGLEHLLLAMLRTDCPGSARDVLESLGLSAVELRESFVEGMGDPFEPPAAEIAEWDEPQLTLRRASTVACRLRDEVVGTEHVLIAAAEEWEPVGFGPLVSRGITSAISYDRVLAITEGTVPIWNLPAVESASEKRRSTYIGPDLAPTPAGRDPRRRKPWGSIPFLDAKLCAMTVGSTVLQYQVDRDGNPVLTVEGRPIRVAIDDDGEPVPDANGEPTFEAFDPPPDAKIRPAQPM